VIQGNRIFISSGYGKGGSALDLSSGQPKEVWFNKEIRSQMAGTVMIGDYIYGQDGQGGDKNGTIKCLDLKTGQVKWTSPQAETGALAAVDGRLVWLTGRGEVVVIEAKPDAYQEVARAQVAGGKYWTVPVVHQGRLYIRNWKGELVSLDVRGKGPVI
jgi:outer membrane protein assembly factor BamB